MSAIQEPLFGQYGTWEANHPECVERGLNTTHETRMIILLFASICFCQVLFMASRAPRVTWEAVYLPLVETVLYSMAASGNGQMRLGDGRVVPIARFCSWLITCPIMLFQVVNIHQVEWYGVPVRNMVMAASLIRTVFGIGASVSTVDATRWAQYGLSCFFFLFELIAVYQIFGAGLHKFSQVKTRVNNVVFARLMVLRAVFYISWNSFPVIWLLSNTGLCLISENATVLAYLVADMVCKNLYGIINTNTLFQVLNGSWTPETGKETVTHRDVGETYLEMLISNLRGQRRDQDESEDDEEASSGVGASPEHVPPHVPPLDHASARSFTRREAKEAMMRYGESMKVKNRSPEIFLDERDLPRVNPATVPRADRDHDRHANGHDVSILMSDHRSGRHSQLASPRAGPADRMLSPRLEDHPHTHTHTHSHAHPQSASAAARDMRAAERLSKEELLELVRRLAPAASPPTSPRTQPRGSLRRDRGPSAERLHSAELYPRTTIALPPNYGNSRSRDRGRSRDTSPERAGSPQEEEGHAMVAA